MQKLFIKNRKQQNIAVLVEKAENPQGLVFVMHGSSGSKTQDHIELFAKAFRDNSYSVIRFDTTNSLGESDGDPSDVTITGFYQDLEDVIEWSHSQDFYQEPFALCGHSLGGICIILYTQHHPQMVNKLIPISSVLSGPAFIKRVCSEEELTKWKQNGMREYIAKRGIKKRLKYGFAEDAFNYDVLKDAHKITTPTLLIVGELDDGAPVEEQRLFLDRLSGKKELHIIKNAPIPLSLKNIWMKCIVL
jgi:pimeloyl-ACP methyl ester carboxylesterase